MNRWLLPLIATGAVVAATAFLSKPGEVCVGGYTTSLAGRSRSQRHNSQLSLDNLQGITLAPGETFSFNKVVGSFSRDEGYRRAPVSYNGQLIESWGGGVCQTSTTLYNAALLAGLKIVERNRHRFAPSYVPPGRDAAVAYSEIDLKLRNPYSFPVRILGEIKGDRLSLGFYAAQSLPNRPVIEGDVREAKTPDTYQIGKPHGFARVRNSGKTGFQVAVYRVIGNKKELISMDSYPGMSRVIEYR